MFASSCLDHGVKSWEGGGFREISEVGNGPKFKSVPYFINLLSVQKNSVLADTLLVKTLTKC